MGDTRYRPAMAFWSGVLATVGLLLLGSTVQFAATAGGLVLESATASDMGSLTGVFALIVMLFLGVLGVFMCIAGVIVGGSAAREWRRERSPGTGAVTFVRHPASMTLMGAIAGPVTAYLLLTSLTRLAEWDIAAQVKASGTSFVDEQETIVLATGASVTVPAGWSAMVHEPDTATGRQVVQFLPSNGDEGLNFSSWDGDYPPPNPETDFYVDQATGFGGAEPVESIDYRGWTGTAAGRSSSGDGTAAYDVTAYLKDRHGNAVVVCSGWPELSADGAADASVVTGRLIDALNLQPSP